MVKDIKVYTRITCAPCKMLKNYLKYKGLAFQEISVDENENAMKEAYQLSGFTMVPVTVIEKLDGTKEVISGYNLSSLAKLV